MHSVLFKIGSVTIYSYGAMIALGMLAALALAYYRVKKAGLQTDMVWNIALYGILGGLVGAKLLYIITELGAIIENPALLLDVGNGFVIYGGIIGGVLTVWLYCKVKKVSFMDYLDPVIPAVPLAQAFGRIGCFFAGCCYGKATDGWCGVVFPAGSLAPAGVPLIPTQLLSAAGDLLIVALMLLVSRHRKYRGQVAAWYMLLYGVGRFLIEFLRNDPRGAVGILSTSQFLSLFIVLGGVFFSLLWRRKNSLR